MNLVDGATTFPVLVGNDTSLTRSEDVVRCMEAVGWADCHRYDFLARLWNGLNFF